MQSIFCFSGRSLSIEWQKTLKNTKHLKVLSIDFKQGRIHGNPVADGWAGAVMRKPLLIQKCDGHMDKQTDGPRPGDS